MAALNCTPRKNRLRLTARSEEAKKPRQNKPTGYKVLKPTGTTHTQLATNAEGTGTEKQYTLYFAQDVTETPQPALNQQTQIPNTGCSSTTKYGQHASYNFCVVTKLKRPTMTNSPLPAVIARSVQNLASKVQKQAATKMRQPSNPSKSPSLQEKLQCKPNCKSTALGLCNPTSSRNHHSTRAINSQSFQPSYSFPVCI